MAFECLFFIVSENYNQKRQSSDLINFIQENFPFNYSLIIRNPDPMFGSDS